MAYLQEHYQHTGNYTTKEKPLPQQPAPMCLSIYPWGGAEPCEALLSLLLMLMGPLLCDSHVLTAAASTTGPQPWQARRRVLYNT